MAYDDIVYDAFLNKLAILDGKSIGAALFTAAYVPLPTDPTIDDITGEATGTGYTRQTFDCTYTAPRCFVADADQWPTFDASALDVHHDRAVFYTNEDIDFDGDTIPAGTLISNIRFGDQAPTASWVLEPLNGFAGASRTPGLPVPSPDDEGKVPTVDGDGNYALTEPTSGAPDPGDWLSITPPADWANLGDPAIQDDPTLPTLQVRHSAAADQVDIRWEGFAAAADVASALVDGAITFTALIPAGYRPASILGHPYAALRIGHSYPDGPIIPAQIAINAAGDMFVRVGTTLPDGVTSLTTYLGGADGVILTIGGNYPLT